MMKESGNGITHYNLDQFSLDKLITVRDMVKAELSLYEFLKQAWPSIEGDKPFSGNWHIGAIAEHLEAVANREIRNLIINIPPRCSKSSLVSVAFPAWQWLHNANEQFLYASYAMSLSLRDSVKCRRLILSPWYQERWGHLYGLVGDQNTKGRFDNTKRGYRISTSAGGSITGEGGSIILCDDPNNASEGDSEVQRESKLDWWTQVWSTRLNNKTKDCKVVIQQRLHERDITGFIIDHDENNEWTKLILPMRFEEKRCAVTVVLPSTKGEVWRDPRVKEGTLLWPERFSEEDVRSLELTLGSYGAAGQLQQRPSPEAGGILKKEWFQWWKDTTLPQIEQVIQSWDTAFSKGKDACYSACTTWGLFYDHNRIENLILLSMWRGKEEYVELRNRVKRLYFDYRDTGKDRESRFTGKNVDMCLIEAKASGDPLIKDLRIAGIAAHAINPSTKTDKVLRVKLVSHLIENGRVWVPARGPKFDTLLPYADEFVNLAACFPNLESNDVIDTTSQVLLKLKDRMTIYNTKDDNLWNVPSYKEPVRVY